MKKDGSKPEPRNLAQAQLESLAYTQKFLGQGSTRKLQPPRKLRPFLDIRYICVVKWLLINVQEDGRVICEQSEFMKTIFNLYAERRIDIIEVQLSCVYLEAQRALFEYELREAMQPRVITTSRGPNFRDPGKIRHQMNLIENTVNRKAFRFRPEVNDETFQFAPLVFSSVNISLNEAQLEALKQLIDEYGHAFLNGDLKDQDTEFWGFTKHGEALKKIAELKVAQGFEQSNLLFNEFEFGEEQLRFLETFLVLEKQGLLQIRELGFMNPPEATQDKPVVSLPPFPWCKEGWFYVRVDVSNLLKDEIKSQKSMTKTKKRDSSNEESTSKFGDCEIVTKDGDLKKGAILLVGGKNVEEYGINRSDAAKAARTLSILRKEKIESNKELSEKYKEVNSRKYRTGKFTQEQKGSDLINKTKYVLKKCQSMVSLDGFKVKFPE